MKPSKPLNWFQQIFCFREESNDDGLTRQITAEIKQEPQVLSSVNRCNQWLSKQQSFEVDYINESIEAVARNEERLLLNRQLSYMQQDADLHKTSFSDEFKSGLLEMKLVHQCGGLLTRQTRSQLEQSHSDWLVKMFKDEQQHDFMLTKQVEKKFHSCLVPPAICDIISKRAKSDSILLSHDPSGSILFRLVAASRKILYLEQSRTFSGVVDRGIAALQIGNKVQKVLKMDINMKVDTAIVNLFSQEEVYLKNIMYEYLELAHDLIVILPPQLDNSIIYRNAEAAIRLSYDIVYNISEQSKQSCSIDLQMIYEGSKLVAKILYYGEVSEISLNEELNYLYSCLSIPIKKAYNYKLLIRDLRTQMGMTTLVQTFYDNQMLMDCSEVVFQRFIRSVKEQYLPDVSRYIQQHSMQEHTDSASSTESEGEQEIKLNEKVYSLSDVQHTQLPPIVVLRHTHSQPAQILL